jgi:UDP-N-acetylmuramyl pentapeptide phosphotransferase/UDP-N-acetylglucosamine-1-phosphate transferase
VTGAGLALLAVGAAAVAWVAQALALRRPPASLTRANYRGRTVSLGGGLVAFAVVLTGACGVAALADGRTSKAGTAALVAALAGGAAGVYDDLYGSPAARGLAGHLRALLRGRVTSGLVKLIVVGLGAVAAALVLDGAGGRAVADAVLVAGSTNLLNLFDLRPGRALKVALVVASRTVAPLAAVLAGTAAGLLPDDLAERGMLGDGGANALGAVAGVTVAAAARSLPWALAATAAVVAATLASEVVSFSRVIDGVPPLRWADRLGRAA